jgi:hypothetical protein
MPYAKPTEFLTITIDPPLRRRIERFRQESMRQTGFALSRSGVVRALLVRALAMNASNAAEEDEPLASSAA